MPPEWRGTRTGSYKDFPLLVKFLFPTEKLSIQVHPDDAFAGEFEHAAGGRGKTEMWHIVSAEPGAELLLGLKSGVTREDFLRGIAQGNVEELFLRYTVHAGETYFVEPGTQHAILPGMIVCEVQEYSDLTYRVYDYGRVDGQGKPRELHLEKALEVTRFDGTAQRQNYAPATALTRCQQAFAGGLRIFCHRAMGLRPNHADRKRPVRISIDRYIDRARASFTILRCRHPVFGLARHGSCPRRCRWHCCGRKQLISLLRITVPDTNSSRHG